MSHSTKQMFDEISAYRFAQEWIDAWNSHQIERILDHYASSIEFTSPFVTRLTDNSNGKITNKNDLEQYFLQALHLYPQLKFELINVYISPDSLIIHYRSVNDRLAAEYFQFDSNKKVIRSTAHYLIASKSEHSTEP